MIRFTFRLGFAHRCVRGASFPPSLQRFPSFFGKMTTTESRVLTTLRWFAGGVDVRTVAVVCGIAENSAMTCLTGLQGAMQCVVRDGRFVAVDRGRDPPLLTSHTTLMQLVSLAETHFDWPLSSEALVETIGRLHVPPICDVGTLDTLIRHLRIEQSPGVLPLSSDRTNAEVPLT
jgi:hypothetical protein